MSIRITNTQTGETKKVEGKMMVAPNGVIFVKQGSKTVFASGSTEIICEEV